MLLQMHYRGIVIEAFGAGGLHFVRRDLIAKLQAAARAGITVVVCSQCLYEPSDFSVYEVGQKALEQGVIQGRDMTTEAAVTKLMWAPGPDRRHRDRPGLHGALPGRGDGVRRREGWTGLTSARRRRGTTPPSGTFTTPSPTRWRTRPTAPAGEGRVPRTGVSEGLHPAGGAVPGLPGRGAGGLHGGQPRLQRGLPLRGLGGGGGGRRAAGDPRPGGAPGLPPAGTGQGDGPPRPPDGPGPGTENRPLDVLGATSPPSGPIPPWASAMWTTLRMFYEDTGWTDYKAFEYLL